MAESPGDVRTRFAPSPSGHLHVGGARTALFCRAFAKGRNGRFILRIEDTDQKRSSDAASLAFLEDLKWLGIEWDEGPEYQGCGGGRFGPYAQSERLPVYHRYIDQLLAEGKAYRAFETPQEIEAARAQAQREKRDYRYDRAALKLDDATVQRYLQEGRSYVVRLKTPEEPVVVHDQIRGDVTTPPEKLDDFVILKADRWPTYHFAVVVDDELMGITHVIRAQEHLTNTPKHILLQDALRFRRPVYAHLSLIFNPDGTKMSKRDKDKALRQYVREHGVTSKTIDEKTWKWWLSSKDHQLELDDARRLAGEFHLQLPEIDVDDFRRAGYLPEVLVNYLALLGWSPGENIEKFDHSFLIERFDLDRVQRSDARFDREKLLAFNLDAIQAMSVEKFTEHYREHCAQYHPEFLEKLDEKQFRMLAAANQPRAKTLDDTISSSRFFITADDKVQYEQSKSVRKALVKGEPCGFDHLQAILPHLEQLDRWDPDTLEDSIRAFAEQQAGDNLGKVAQPLRVAVSGAVVSPAIFETLAILGRDRTINRIRRCLALREAMSSPA